MTINAIVVLAIFVPGTSTGGGSGWAQASSAQDTQELVRQLWSPDEGVRSSAKEALRKIGSTASRPLMAVLQEMLDHQFVPHFATGKEAEGARWWADPQGYPEGAKFDIGGRLRTDCLDLLADLGAVEAVPLMIRAMDEELVLDMNENYSSSIYDLIKVGEPAVPALVENIKNAYSIAEAIHRKPAPYQEAPDLADRIRIRSAMALGGIGDARALPILEEISKPGSAFEDKSLGLAVDYYMNQIRKKQHMPTR